MRSFVLLLAVMGLACSVPIKTQQAMQSDWELAESIRGSRASALHQKIFGLGPLDGKKYREFFAKRVSAVRGEGILFASCHGAFACDAGGGEIRLSSKYSELEVPAVVRLSLLLHEARHAQGADHVECPDQTLVSPFQKTDLRGMRECDADETGAYGAQWVMLSNIARYCESCDAEMRLRAREYSGFLIQLIRSPQARQKLLADESQ